MSMPKFPSSICFILQQIQMKNLTSCKLVDVHAKVLLQPHVDKVGLEAGNGVSQNGDETCIRQQPSHFLVVPFAARNNGNTNRIWQKQLLYFNFLCLDLRVVYLWEANISTRDADCLLQIKSFSFRKKFCTAATWSLKGEKAACRRRHGFPLAMQMTNCAVLRAWGYKGSFRLGGIQRTKHGLWWVC